MREELDRVAPARRAVAEDFFHRAVEIELAFFDASYAHPIAGEKQ